MKVIVKEPILVKILRVIKAQKRCNRNIERIELNPVEFSELYSNICDLNDDEEFMVKLVTGVDKGGRVDIERENYSDKARMSGSHVVINGVCVQTHETYNSATHSIQVEVSVR